MPLGAEQNMNRLLIELTRNVPQGNIYSGDGLNGDTAAAVVNAASIHLVPEPFCFEGILSND